MKQKYYDEFNRPQISIVGVTNNLFESNSILDQYPTSKSLKNG
jgi:hypothetical protein